MAKSKENNSYGEMVKFYNKKEHESAGGKFFVIHRHKQPTQHGVWAHSKKELINHLNKIRDAFTKVEEYI